MIVTEDEPLSDLFRLLRAHGWARNARHGVPRLPDGIDPRYVFLNWGFNVRPTELQAGFGLRQLERLPAFHRNRRNSAERFRAFLQPRRSMLRLMETPANGECSWFALPVVLAEDTPFKRAELTRYLEEEGVETRPIVAGNLARQPVFEYFPELRRADLPGADVVHDRGFYLGLHPFANDALIDRLCETIDRFLRRYE